jgi:hypothetical protein
MALTFGGAQFGAKQNTLLKGGRLGAPGTSPATYRRSECGITSVVVVLNL